MLHDINPHRFNNNFNKKTPAKTDWVLNFDSNDVLLKDNNGNFELPTFEFLTEFCPNLENNLIYLFSIDNTGFYLLSEKITDFADLKDYKYVNCYEKRKILPKYLTFIIATAMHLSTWYDENKYCGKCSSKMVHSDTERAMCCKNCGNINYPKISPAVIVGVIDKCKNKLLMTRYADRDYKKLALIAGFTEIGESIEQTVKREVKEEVGLRVKNIQYFKSQPWAFSQSVLMGFWAELDGSSDFVVDGVEISEAIWLSPDEIPAQDSDISLTATMIETFGNNLYKTLF